MANTLKANMARFMAMFAVSIVFALACASSAFAADIDISVPTANKGPTITATVDTDDLTYSSSPAVYGQYFKSGAWNYLATNYYVSFDNMMQAALDVYNAENHTSYTLSDLSWSTMTLIVADEGGSTYLKYNPTYSDIYNRLYIYENGLNSAYTYQNSCAAFAFKYGAGASTAAALTACNSATVQSYPRLIMGIDNGMTTSETAGKRYPSDIMGIILS